MFDEDSKKGTKYLEKKNFVFKIIAFESGAVKHEKSASIEISEVFASL